MTTRVRQSQTVEQLYPNAKARRAADEVVDKMGCEHTMSEFLVAWDQAYCAVAGTSPFQQGKKEKP